MKFERTAPELVCGTGPMLAKNERIFTMTSPDTTHEWRRHERRKHGVLWVLVPPNSPKFILFGEIARVFYLSGSRRWYGSYQFFGSTGAPQSGTVIRGSTLSARRWIEGRLAQFWAPPTIVNPT